MSEQPNILFVTVDSLRADYVHTEGVETPTFDSLASSGTAFTSTFSQGPYTTFSMPSLFTSKYPSQLTSIDFVEGVEGVLVEDAPTIQSQLQEAGYTTAGIHTNPLLSELFGFDVGFDYFYDGLGGLSSALPGKLKLLADKLERIVSPNPYVPADTLTDKAIHWLERNDDEPVFLWVHYMDVHGPYQSKSGFQYVEKYKSERLWRKAVHAPSTVTDEERSRLKQTYIEEIEFTDHEIGRLIDGFDESMGAAESMIALTADHGEEFFEHGSYSHESKLYDELLNVPLIVDPPESGGPLEQNSDSLVSLLDVGPTLLETADGNSDGFEGTSLFAKSDVDSVGDSQTDNSLVTGTEVVVSEAQVNPAYIGAVRTSEWKYIERPGEKELYNLVKDPDESTDVSEVHEEITSCFEGCLAEHHERHSGEQRAEQHLESDELDGQLRSLGYLE